jgi:hypothetical protein
VQKPAKYVEHTGDIQYIICIDREDIEQKGRWIEEIGDIEDKIGKDREEN